MAHQHGDHAHLQAAAYAKSAPVFAPPGGARPRASPPPPPGSSTPPPPARGPYARGPQPVPVPGRDRDYTPGGNSAGGIIPGSQVSQAATEPLSRSICDDFSSPQAGGVGRRGYSASPPGVGGGYGDYAAMPPPQPRYVKMPPGQHRPPVHTGEDGSTPLMYRRAGSPPPLPQQQQQQQQQYASPEARVPQPQPQTLIDARAHPSAPIINALVAASGDRWCDRNAYHTATGLDGLLNLKQGLYLTRFDSTGAEECWFTLGRPLGDGGYTDYHTDATCLIIAPSPEDVDYVGVQRLPLTALRGVQRGASTKGFLRHYAGPNRIAGVAMNKQRAIHPSSICFTLWFDVGSGFQPIDLAAVNEGIYERVVQAFEAVRKTNNASNYVCEVSPPRTYPAARGHSPPGAQGSGAGWERKDDTTCLIQ